MQRDHDLALNNKSATPPRKVWKEPRITTYAASSAEGAADISTDGIDIPS